MFFHGTPLKPKTPTRPAEEPFRRQAAVRRPSGGRRLFVLFLRVFLEKLLAFGLPPRLVVSPVFGLVGSATFAVFVPTFSMSMVMTARAASETSEEKPRQDQKPEGLGVADGSHGRENRRHQPVPNKLDRQSEQKDKDDHDSRAARAPTPAKNPRFAAVSCLVASKFPIHISSFNKLLSPPPSPAA